MSQSIIDKPWTKYWIKKFKTDIEYGDKRFKRIKKGYPYFEIDNELIDIVELDDFIKIEPNRFPLFIGSQFGIHPKLNEISDFFNGEKVIAVLSKSVLSGSVSGLSLHKINKNDKKFIPNKIQHYGNV